MSVDESSGSPNSVSSACTTACSGTRTPIRELAGTIAKVAGYEGEIRWDTSKPDGQMVKIFDTQKMSALGLSCPTTMEEGLERTIAWYREFLA